MAKDHKSKNHKSKDNKSKDHESKDHESKDHKSKDQGSKDHKSKDHESKDHESKDHESKDHKSKDHESKDHESKDHKSKDLKSKDHKSKDHKSKDKSETFKIVSVSLWGQLQARAAVPTGTPNVLNIEMILDHPANGVSVVDISFRPSDSGFGPPEAYNHHDGIYHFVELYSDEDISHALKILCDSPNPTITFDPNDPKKSWYTLASNRLKSA